MFQRECKIRRFCWFCNGVDKRDGGGEKWGIGVDQAGQKVFRKNTDLLIINDLGDFFLKNHSPGSISTKYVYC